MDTFILILILFLGAIFSTLLYFKNRHSRVDKLNAGECPTCKAKSTIFFDKKTNTTFRNEIISSKVLKNHGCSGGVDIEYICKNCGTKEVHQAAGSQCGL